MYAYFFTAAGPGAQARGVHGCSKFFELVSELFRSHVRFFKDHRSHLHCSEPFATMVVVEELVPFGAIKARYFVIFREFIRMFDSLCPFPRELIRQKTGIVVEHEDVRDDARFENPIGAPRVIYPSEGSVTITIDMVHTCLAVVSVFLHVDHSQFF